MTSNLSLQTHSGRLSPQNNSVRFEVFLQMMVRKMYRLDLTMPKYELEISAEIVKSIRVFFINFIF